MKRDTNKTMMLTTHQFALESGCYAKAAPIMNYFLPEGYHVTELTNYEFDFIAKVNFGGSEGIYIDCYIEGKFDETGEYKKLECGTYKTLDTDLKAMQIMGELAGSLTYYNNQYVNKEIDRYTPASEYSIGINCSMDMYEKVRDFTKNHINDFNADKNVLLVDKIAKQLSNERTGKRNVERFSFDEISKIEQALNESKDKTKIYRAKDGQQYSLEPILNDGRYCSEKECDVAGTYSIPDQFDIIISGGRLRLDDFTYLADNDGEPVIKAYKENNIEQFELKKVSEDVSMLGGLKLSDLDKKIERSRNQANLRKNDADIIENHMER